MEESGVLILPPNGAEIVKRCHAALLQALQGKFQCAARIQNVEDAAALPFSNSKAAIVPEIKYNKQLSKNLKVSVWKDDLTTHQVDAVVNAANERLSHYGGLASALSRAGGPNIQKWSDDIIEKCGKIRTGDVVSTPAASLPCKMIIHAVGPCVSLRPTSRELGEASELLQKTVQNILKKACFENLQSVAIPAISSGLFNFPLANCAEIIVNTMKSVGEKFNAGARSLEVRLVNNDDPSVQEMLKACLRILGQSDPLPMQNLGNPPAQSSFPSVDLRNVTLYLKKGAIENEATDVIVNTTGADFDLSKGQVSKALQEKAGRQLQQELKQQVRGYVHESEVIATSGCKLKCKAVYHTVCAHKNDSGNSAEKVLKSVVTSCLKMACSKGYSSISFPALGTGNLGLKSEVVSNVMTAAVEEFSSMYTGSKINIFFVIFPRDTQTLKAFERKMESTNARLQSQVSGNTNGKRPGFYQSPEIEAPFIELLAPSPEAHREAKSWLHRILYSFPDKLEILNNNVVHLSLEDHEKLTSLQSGFHVEITEMFKSGHGRIIIKGGSFGVGCAALEVEALLCQAQENFARNEEKYMQGDLNNFGQQIEMSNRYQKTLLTSLEAQDCTKRFTKYGLNVVKVEKIKNSAVMQLFLLNSKRIQAQPQRLYQRVSAQFIELICRVGFQREYAPPKELKYGAGIYFTSDLEKANYFWPENEEEFVYFIEAQVLTGKDTVGLPEMIVPPPIGSDPLVCFDSVTNNTGIHVIFNGQQAYPEFLITCRKKDTGTYC